MDCFGILVRCVEKSFNSPMGKTLVTVTDSIRRGATDFSETDLLSLMSFEDLPSGWGEETLTLNGFQHYLSDSGVHYFLNGNGINTECLFEGNYRPMVLDNGETILSFSQGGGSESPDSIKIPNIKSFWADDTYFFFTTIHSAPRRIEFSEVDVWTTTEPVEIEI